ncbi:MAG: hypothetical protein WCB99_14480 [Candidatus Cybelea sp.]
MASDPQKYNQALTDEIMRECSVKAARYAIKLLDDALTGQMIVNFDDHIGAVGSLINGCAAAMIFPDDKDKVPDFDSD